MTILDQALAKVWGIIRKKAIQETAPVEIKPLTAVAAIGEKADKELALARGTEVILEASFGEGIGQAFTGEPVGWSGTLAQALALPTDTVVGRARVVATLNALLHHLGLIHGTVHCRDGQPFECGDILLEKVMKRHLDQRIALVGLQPGFAAALGRVSPPDRVRILDLNPLNIGQKKGGVLVEDGEKKQEEVLLWCDFALVTGSALVNGTLERVLEILNTARKEHLLFGNTIRGVAYLLGLPHYCELAGDSRSGGNS